MHSRIDCLELIQSVRDAASDPESAYLLRTRLKRTLLSISRLAAGKAGLEDPLLPTMVFLTDAIPSNMRQLLKTCNDLLANTRNLCQPSEALDIRWRSGWNTVLDELSDLESQLMEFPD